MKATTTMLLGALLALASIALASPAAPDPFIGTWKLDVSKSKFTREAPKSQTRTYEKSADGMMTVTVKTVTADGKETTGSITFKADGKDYPITGAPDVDSVSERRVDPRSATYTLKKAGKTIETGRRTVSRDGRTLRMIAKGTNASGAKFEDKMVYEKE